MLSAFFFPWKVDGSFFFHCGGSSPPLTLLIEEMLWLRFFIAGK
jgi:hypothetical protein